jgi:hypothetical protein
LCFSANARLRVMTFKSVTADGLREYLTTFHDSLRLLADRYLPAEVRRNPSHAAYLPSQVIGYISTQFGVAYEYIPFESNTGAETTIYEMRGGSARVENLILAGAPKVMLEAPPALSIVGSRYWVIGMNVQGPFRLGRDEAHIVFDRCLFSWPISVGRIWWKGTGLLEVYGDRRAELWTPDKAVVRAQQEVLAALFEVDRARQKGLSRAEYIARYREKQVLVLGSYSAGGRARLDKMKAILTELGYDPILLSDVPDQPAQTLQQKVVMLGSVSRFVVMDDSEKSGALAELPLCQGNGWVTAILRLGGRPSSAMSKDAGLLSSVIVELAYDEAGPRAVLESAVRWAERRRSELASASQLPPQGAGPFPFEPQE